MSEGEKGDGAMSDGAKRDGAMRDAAATEGPAKAPIVMMPLEDGAELPPLQKGVLDGAAFAAYRAQLLRAATDVEVFVKAGAQRQGAHPDVSLERGLAMLGDGLLHSVQLRYHFEGVAWIDTLRRVDDGVAIVRMAAPSWVAPG